MKIVLANPARGTNLHADVLGYPNMGLLSLIGYLREKMGSDIEIEYIETMLMEEHLRKIREIKPDIYGLSFASYTLKYEITPFQLIEEVKRAFPSLPVICGGTHPTAMPEGVLENSKADVVCIGEGEETLHELILYYQGQINSLEDIDGIAYRRENGEIARTRKRRFCDIDKLPMPAWDIIDLKDYLGPHLRKTDGYATCVLSSRGCPYNCVYCSNPVWRTDKPWFRRRDPALVAKEIGYLYGRGVREIYIRADELNPNIEWCLSLCREIKKGGWKDLYFQCNLRPDAINEELAASLAEINCWLVYLGIESVNQRVIDGIDKKYKFEKVPGFCGILKRHNIKVFGFMMFYQVWEEKNGLQWETPSEVDNTLRVTRWMLKSRLLDYISWQIATPVPGSRLWDIAKKYNLIKGDIGNSWDVSMRIPGIDDRKIVRQRLAGFLIQAYFAFRNGNINWRMWKRIIRKMSYMASSFFYILGSGADNRLLKGRKA